VANVEPGRAEPDVATLDQPTPDVGVEEGFLLLVPDVTGVPHAAVGAALAAGRLPVLHRDPFDRMLIA
jgi:hypothetical protein